MAGAELSEQTVASAVEEALASPPFTSPGLRELWPLLRDWYLTAVERWSREQPALFWTGLALLVLLLVLVSWHLSTALSAALRAARRPGPRRAVARDGATPVDLAAAHAALARGDCRGAVELAFEQLSSHLAPGVGCPTPRELAGSARLRLGAERAALLERVVRLHEEICYAGAAATPARAREALSACAALGSRA